MLLERAAQLDAIDEALEAGADGLGGALVFEAPAGLGKTAILDAARDKAIAAGYRVLTARASELERDFGFGVARQLFEPVVRAASGQRRERLLHGAAARAEALLGVETAMALPPPSVDTEERSLHALYWLVANLADEAPMLISADDLHWADAASLRFLAFLLGRLAGLRGAVVLTSRPVEETAAPELLARVLGHPIVTIAHPRALSPVATAQLVRLVFDDAADEFCAACHDATAGNPFFVRQLLGDLERHGYEPTPKGAERVRGVAPRTVSRAALGRIAAIGAGAIELAFAVAVLGDGATLHDAAQLADLDIDTAGQRAAALVRASILRHHDGLEFVHPIVRAALTAELGPVRAGAWHRRAARLLSERGAEPARVAAHLVLSPPAREPETVATLRAAAQPALAAGAPDSAVRYLARALAEPPPRNERPGLLFELGASELMAREPTAEGHLANALDSAEDPIIVASAALMLSRLRFRQGRMDDAAHVLESTLQRRPSIQGDIALGLALDLHGVNKFRAHARPGILQETDALHRRVRSASTPVERLALTIVATVGAMANRPAETVGNLAEEAFAEDLLPVIGLDSIVAPAGIWTLIFTERYDAASRVLETIIDMAHRQASPFAFALASCTAATLHHRLGAVHDAEANANAAITLARDHQWPWLEAVVGGLLAAIHIDRGGIDTATRLIEPLELDHPIVGATNHALHARALIRAEQGRRQAAVEDLLEIGRRHTEFGGLSPAIIPWRSDAAIILAGLGDHARARDLVTTEVELARAFGTPRPIGVALRAAGLVESGRNGLELLREAVGVLAASRARLEHARALVDLGAALRRTNHRAEARDPLREGMDLAHRCGALALAERARIELQATGARPRRILLTGADALTATERRVCEIAAAGASNADIAQELFVTRKTVESHLSSAYRKLGITSRQHLARALKG